MIKFFVDPFNIFFLIILSTIVAYTLKRERLFFFMGVFSVAWLLLITTPFISHPLLVSLERLYLPINTQEIADKQAEYHIIVLGGGHGFDNDLPPNSLLSLQALARLNEGIRLHLQLPNSKLVLSGFSSTPGRTTQAEMLQKTALLLGVNDDNIIMQKKPGNTFEEANIYSSRFRDEYVVLLVSSASHMHRAVKSFEYFGVNVKPSPAHFRILNPDSGRSWWPSITNTSNLRTVLYEYAGLFYYRHVLMK